MKLMFSCLSSGELQKNYRITSVWMNPTQAQHSIKRDLQLFYHKINPSFILCMCAEVRSRASRGKQSPLEVIFLLSLWAFQRKTQICIRVELNVRLLSVLVCVCLRLSVLIQADDLKPRYQRTERRVHCKWPTFSIHRGRTEQRHGEPPASKTKKEDMLLIDQTQIKTTDRESGEKERKRHLK